MIHVWEDEEAMQAITGGPVRCLNTEEVRELFGRQAWETLADEEPGE